MTLKFALSAYQLLQLETARLFTAYVGSTPARCAGHLHRMQSAIRTAPQALTTNAAALMAKTVPHSPCGVAQILGRLSR